MEQPKKLIRKLHKKLTTLQAQERFNPIALTIFVLLIGGAGLLIIRSFASPTPPTVYLSPASASIGANGTITVQVRENSGTTGVNAVQANFSYPATLFTCGTIDASTSAFGITAQSTCSGGQVTIARGVSGGSPALTGDQLVAIVTFTANTTGGSASMAFTSGTALVSATTNQDILGSLTATAGGTYIVDTTPPSASVTAPVNSAKLTYGSNSTISVTATDGQTSVSKVDIYIDGALKATLTSSPYNYTWSGASLGAHTIQAKATDAVGNVGSSTVINVTVADLTPPTISITAPKANTVVSGATATVSATATDNVGVASVQFLLDGTNLGSAVTTSPYTLSWNSTSVSSGSHSLTAVAKDAAGNTTTATTVSIIVDNTAPTVSISFPAASATVSGTVTVTTSAADNSGGSGVAKVELYVDGTLLATDTVAPYTFSWDTTLLPSGAHTLLAKAYDQASPSNTASSTSVGVTVSNVTPGDINNDGTVNIIDLSILLSHYNTNDPSSDLNHDGIVNTIDLSILLSHYGQ